MGARNNVRRGRRAWGMIRQLGREAGDNIGSTIRDSDSRQVLEEFFTPTPSVVFSILNINMRTAIPSSTNAKNRPNLGAIFSAVRAARAAKFGRRVVLEGPYHIFFAM